MWRERNGKEHVLGRAQGRGYSPAGGKPARRRGEMWVWVAGRWKDTPDELGHRGLLPQARSARC